MLSHLLLISVTHGWVSQITLCRPAQLSLFSSDALPPQKLKSRSQFLSKQKSSCFSFLLTYFGTVPKYSSSTGGVARTCQYACPVLTALDPPSPSPARSSPAPFQSLPRLVWTPSLAPPDSSTRFPGKTVSSPPEAPRTPSRFSALTQGNCSRSPRRWSRPGRFRRSFPHKGASSRRRRSSYCRLAERSALPAGFLPPSLPGFCRRRSLGGAVGSWRFFPTLQPSQGARPGTGHAPQRGRGPSASSCARPGHSPGPASLGRCGFLLVNMEGRTRAGQWLPRGVGRGVGMPPRTWEPGVERWGWPPAAGAGAGARAHGAGVSGEGSWVLGHHLQAVISPAEFLPSV
jgi:hypothetical protein